MKTRLKMAVLLAWLCGACSADPAVSPTPAWQAPHAPRAISARADVTKREPQRVHASPLRVGFLSPSYGQTNVGSDAALKLFATGIGNGVTGADVAKSVEAAFTLTRVSDGMALDCALDYLPHVAANGQSVGDLVLTARPSLPLDRGSEYEARIGSTKDVAASFLHHLRFRVGSSPRVAELRFAPKGKQGDIAYVVVRFSEQVVASGSAIEVLAGSPPSVALSHSLPTKLDETTLTLPSALSKDSILRLRFVGALAGTESGVAFNAMKGMPGAAGGASTDTISATPGELPIVDGMFTWRHP